MENKSVTPMLYPYEPSAFWQQLQQIIREEISRIEKSQPPVSNLTETPGLTYKPLFKMAEVCALFQVSKPTIYDWIKDGKLKSFKIKSRVYFLWQDLEQIIQPKNE